MSKKKPEATVVIGTYEIGYEQCQLVIREGTGGEFFWIPEKGCIPRIAIGVDYDNWNEVVAILLHECLEFCKDRAGCRYNPTNTVSPREHGAYMFVMSHATFQDCCAKTAEFITPALPALARAWKKWKGKKRG